MTPKEKAKDLVNKFTPHTKVFHEHLGWVNYLDSTKQCALIAVDEILWEIIKYADNSREYVVENSLYWTEVKKEIEKL
jgi:hypothetical protein